MFGVLKKGDKTPSPADVGTPAADTPETPAPAKSWRERLFSGLARTRAQIGGKLKGIFARGKVDDELLDELETLLLTSDVGVEATQHVLTELKSRAKREKLETPEAIQRAMSDILYALLAPLEVPLKTDTHKPFVIMVAGVNGAGKTTSIGKLAKYFQANGQKVLLAAGDTFRAAATEQLEIWGQRTGVPVVRGKENGDPSSVIFEGVKRAQAEGYDILIADTAGRLHTKANLMEELQKVRRVTDKAMPGAPHETFLVLDSTNGQNAIHQAQMFKDAMGLTGIVLTKLDGTAKGGVILGICDELKIPVRYIGIGEKVEDLREFDPEEFVAALYEDADQAAAA